MKVLVVPNYERPDAVEDAARVESWLVSEGMEVIWVPYNRLQMAQNVDLSDCCLAVSLGGDGTLLRAARTVGYSGIPIVGISYGHLGFLTCAGPQNLFKTISDALAGDLHVSRRATLQVDAEFEAPDGSTRKTSCMALNDLALSHGSLGGVVSFAVSVSGNYIDTLRGDGFIVSTATGSTGYALAAGGPIVTPEFGGMVCVPVAPHTIMARAFLTAPTDVVEICVDRERPAEACVFADGQPLGTGLRPLRVSCKRGRGDILLLDYRAQSFYGSVSRVFYGKADKQ
ncbi:MAG: NAD(+)/NADH kinase [Coriobacteriales bacterium]|nr:NAD(+)/NADH kinase [Coriobacteriales bacterium]